MARQGRRRLLGLVGAVCVVAAIVSLLVLAWPNGGAPANCAPPKPQGLVGAESYVLAPCHSSVELAPRSYASYQVVRLSDGETVAGQFAASSAPNITVNPYVLNSSQFGDLPTAPSTPPPSYFWGSGPVTDLNLSVQVPGSPAQFFVVIENLGPDPITITWTEELVIYYVS